jgi:hypothetical protein
MDLYAVFWENEYEHQNLVLIEASGEVDAVEIMVDQYFTPKARRGIRTLRVKRIDDFTEVTLR